MKKHRPKEEMTCRILMLESGKRVPVKPGTRPRMVLQGGVGREIVRGYERRGAIPPAHSE
jgi:hypothetical protein